MSGVDETAVSWYSDEALAKQAAIKAKSDRGEAISLTDILGVIEPRVHATTAERCVCCGLDARAEVDGEEHHGQRWCSICTGREHHVDGPHLTPATTTDHQSQPAGGGSEET